MKADTIAGPDWRRPRPERVHRIRDRLRVLYGRPNAQPHGYPIAELILTVLSQSTNDRNRDVAYFGLRERFADWRAVRDAPVDEVEEAIRPGGISKIKSARIKSILAAIAPEPDDSRAARGLQARTGEQGRAGATREQPSLHWLSEVTVAEAQDYLCSLPGVGRKTAACVLLFALGMRDVPVDTHVSRVGMRLHLLRPGAPFAELHDEMLALTPPGEELELHINLLRHGRRTCHARRPACGECALARMCPSAGRF
ncbi:MAG: endonuclease [Solirubrobacteraceae bacterium]|jgi:endonuclease-3|nr:endonuclease [Solirubrobacteraceae bacterium]